MLPIVGRHTLAWKTFNCEALCLRSRDVRGQCPDHRPFMARSQDPRPSGHTHSPVTGSIQYKIMGGLVLGLEYLFHYSTDIPLFLREMLPAVRSLRDSQAGSRTALSPGPTDCGLCAKCRPAFVNLQRTQT